MKIKVYVEDAENGFWLNDCVINVEPERYGWGNLLVLNLPPLHLTVSAEYLEAKENGEI